MANRVMKQKNEKGKKQARDASEARKYGVRDTASYRKEMLHTTERPSKEEREKDSAAASEHFEKIAKDPGKVLGGRAQATRLEKVGGKVVNKPTGKLAAGRDQASVDIETALVKKEYVSGVNKRNAKRDEAASKVDLTPEKRLTGTHHQGLATYRELLQRLSTKMRPDGGALEAILQK